MRKHLVWIIVGLCTVSAVVSLLLISSQKRRNNEIGELKLLNDDEKQTITITIVSGSLTITRNQTIYLLKSIFVHRTTPIILNIASDIDSRDYLVAEVFNKVGHVYPPMTVNFKIVDLQETVRKCEELKFPIVHHSGVWGMTKLFLDQIFVHTDRTIFVDADMIFGTDPALLYSDFSKFEEETVFAWTQEPHWDTGGGPNTVCSCIFLWDMKKSRNLDLMRTMVRPASVKIFGTNEKGEITKTGRNGSDQDFLYALNMVFKNMFQQLDDSWNLTFCHNFWGVKPKSKSQDKTGFFFGAIHFNCMKNKIHDWSGWEWVRDYMEWYRWDWFEKPYTTYGKSTKLKIVHL